MTAAQEPKKLKPLTAKQHEVMTYVEQEFLVSGMVPTPEKAEELGICSKVYYGNCLSSADFRAGMVVRGISLRGISGSDNGILTAEQLTVANIMLDLRDNRSQKNKLKDCNVPTQRWEAWLREPAFQNYLRRRAEALLGDNLHESHLALVDRVRTGDINAIKYFNEITGRYVPNATEKVDVNGILIRVLEIIQKYVKDGDALGFIADELMALSTVTPTMQGFGLTPAPRRIIEQAPLIVSDDGSGVTSL